MKNYDHKKVEKKWQKEWAEQALYATHEDPKKPKAYVLDMFPYPSGEGLHVGHPKGYIATDIYSRHMRMTGHNVLHPMGWDAFGLPAENFAIKNKVHPRTAVSTNINRFKEQLEKIGFDYDWSREINTTDPAYYKWTQWIFLQLYEKGLAYESHEPINWCPSCQTGLANEDLEDGHCERCGSLIVKKPMRQWVLRITDYADRLLSDLDTIPWPEHIKELQRNWIGRSEGAVIGFQVSGVDAHEELKVFTTRPDTLFGATYLVLAPEHSLVLKWKDHISNWEDVEAYIQETAAKTEIERTAEGKEKTGIELKGVKGINPATNEEIPVWIADYVLAQYGTGAIMAVPAHDERDLAFATRFELPVREVIEPLTKRTNGPDAIRTDEPFVERDAVICIVKHWEEDKYLGVKWGANGWQGFFTGGIDDDGAEASGAREIAEESGYVNAEFKEQLGDTVHAQFYQGAKKENRFAHYRVLLFQLRNGERVETSEEEKALHEFVWLTPEEMDAWVTHDDMRIAWNRLRGTGTYTGEGILSRSGEYIGLASDEAKKRITESVGGEWTATYRLRDWVFSRQRYWGEPIPIIHCEKCGVVPVPEKDLPVVLPDVDQYEPTGTGESPLAAIDDWVNTTCPKCNGAGKRETNTMPQWAGSSWYYLRYMDPENTSALVRKEKEAYWAPVDVYVGGAEHATRHLIYARFWHKFLYDTGVVSTPEPFQMLHSVGLIMAEDGRKMSKRYGNVINPDDVVEKWGADTLRVYEMFMGPFENAIAWNMDSMIGARRFLERVWRLQEKVTPDVVDSIETVLHQTIQKVGNDIRAFKFNTAVSQMMICLNAIEKEGQIGQAQWEAFLKLLAPFAPHMADELWHTAGNDTSIHIQTWPSHDPEKLKEEVVTISVQVNGKLRGHFESEVDAAPEEIERVARDQVEKWLEGTTIKKVIHVPGRLVNFVIEQ